MLKGFVLATLVNFAITSVWYAQEYKQFGQLQWDRNCDNIVAVLYYVALCIAFSKW